MRLGSYDAKLQNNSKIKKIYGKKIIKERHRHRYEVNINLKDKFEKKGMSFSGVTDHSFVDFPKRQLDTILFYDPVWNRS